MHHHLSIRTKALAVVASLLTVTSIVVASGADAASPVAPSAPRSVVAVALPDPAIPTQGQVTVTWSPPASDGGSAIARYVVVVVVGAVRSPTGTVAGLSLTTPVTVGTTVAFCVAAVNAAGTGPESCSNPVTVADPAAPALPGRPGPVAATAGRQSATVTWVAPASTGGRPVSGYLVTPYLEDVAQPTRAFNSSALAQVVTGLLADVHYTFRVQAVSLDGIGPLSAPSNVVIPTGSVSGTTSTSTSTTTTTAPVTSAPNRAFVRAAYQDLLGRAPTTAELTSWSSQLDSGARTRAQLATELSASTEWVSAIVQGFYRTTLGRRGDARGLAFWSTQIQTRRATVAAVAARFYSSDEYFRRKGGGSVPTWITDLYRTLLDQVPDSAAVTRWQDATRRQGRGRVAEAIFQSADSRRRRVSGLYQSLLGRAPEASGVEHWAGRIESQGDVALAGALVASDEYYARARTRFPSA